MFVLRLVLRLFLLLVLVGLMLSVRLINGAAEFLDAAVFIFVVDVFIVGLLLTFA